MKDSTTLHLLIPGLLGPMPQLDAVGLGRDLPRLSRLLSRSDQGNGPGQDYASILFALFGHPLKPGLDLPEGAVNALGEGVAAAAEGCWMRADPVHLRADRDRLLLFNASGLALGQTEAEAFTHQFNGHFAADGLRLLAPHAHRWYLRLSDCPDLRTHPLGEVSGRDVDQFMPQGADARRWRQLGNEMQMLLFHAPFNQQRLEAGRPAVNGIWLSGLGRLPEPSRVHFDLVSGDDPTLTGLARLHGIEAQAAPADWGRLWEQEGRLLLACTDLLQTVWNVDPEAWVAELRRTEIRLERLVAGMRRRRHARLTIDSGDGRLFSLTPGGLRRFWRRNPGLRRLLSR